MSTPRIVFAGTPDFATPALRALLASDAQVVAAYTQPDRPAGRNRKPRPSPVKVAAEEAGVPVFQPEQLKGEATQAELTGLAPDLMVVVAYGQLLPRAVLDIPRHGCLNIHASLLPRWRGAAPIARAMLAGDETTGVTLMRMETGLDSGPLVLRRETPIEETDTAGTLHDRLAALGADCLQAALPDLPARLAAAQPQPIEGVTHADKLTKDEGRLDWQRPAAELARRVRALAPWPVAWLKRGDDTVRVWAAHAEAGQGGPGEVLQPTREALRIGTGEGVLCITRLQLPGKKAMDIPALRNGRPDLFAPGETLNHG